MSEIIYVSVQEKSVVFHNVLAQDHGQEFVVGDLLGVSGDDVSRFLWGSKKNQQIRLSNVKAH